MVISSSSFSIASEAAKELKKEGNQHVENGNYTDALMCFTNALDCISPNGVDTPICWSEQERFALTLHSNLALTLLKLHCPAVASTHCQAARDLPVFQVNAPNDVRQKIYLRHIEAILDSRDKERLSGQDPAILHIYNVEAWGILDDARLRGYLSKGNKLSTRAFRKRFVQIASRLNNNNDDNDETITDKTFSSTNNLEDGFFAWLDRFEEYPVTSEAKMKKARQAVLNYEGVDNTKEKEDFILNELSKLIPKPSVSMKQVCDMVVNDIRYGEDPAIAVTKLRQILQKHHLHPCAVDPDTGKNLMGAVNNGLSFWYIQCDQLKHTVKGSNPEDTYLALLSFLMKECNMSINERDVKEKLSVAPLHILHPKANANMIQLLLDQGADITLRDDSGLTVLARVCGRGNEIESKTERIKIVKLLLDSGADVNTQALSGETPIVRLAEKPCSKLFRFLLDHGANVARVTDLGKNAMKLLDDTLTSNKESKECMDMIQEYMSEEDYIFQTKMIKFKKAMKFYEISVKTTKEQFESKRDFMGFSTVGKAERNVQQKRQTIAIVTSLMNYLGLDGTLLQQRLSHKDSHPDNNWLETLYHKLHELVPDVYLKVYRDDDNYDDHEKADVPSRDAVCAMIVECEEALHAGLQTDEYEIPTINYDKAKDALFTPFRDRGVCFGVLMDHFCQLSSRVIQQTISFAVPTMELIYKIKHLNTPIIEVGAGTGYWSGILQANDIDCIAYDMDPPSTDNESANTWFKLTYTKVTKADARTLFKEQPLLSERTLLMVYPNNPDPIDNPQHSGHSIIPFFSQGTYPTVWDADCLKTYIDAGGMCVIYVGEREINIPVMAGCKPDCGVSSSRKFQTMLEEYFELIEIIEIPRWFLHLDDATIWKRKTL